MKLLRTFVVCFVGSRLGSSSKGISICSFHFSIATKNWLRICEGGAAGDPRVLSPNARDGLCNNFIRLLPYLNLLGPQPELHPKAQEPKIPL
eukprot:Skav207889  [mRNA]  locus=scaffold664:733363:746221:+ [translate_table: standard]